jgi:hypothetical protein
VPYKLPEDAYTSDDIYSNKRNNGSLNELLAKELKNNCIKLYQKQIIV